MAAHTSDDMVSFTTRLASVSLEEVPVFSFVELKRYIVTSYPYLTKEVKEANINEIRSIALS